MTTLALGCAWGLTCAPAMAADLTISSEPMKEPVGMAVDLDNDWYWITDGTSATTKSLIALDNTGRQVHRVSWSPALHDVQALSWANGSLYVADIGDASRHRSSISVMSPTTPAAEHSTYYQWSFTYPDGAHDAKAFAVSPRGRFYVITDGPSPAVYSSSAEPSRTGTNSLTRVADAPAGVTDATFLPDGARLALLTAQQVVVMNAYSWQTVASTDVKHGHAISTDTKQKDLEVAMSATSIRGVTIPTTLSSATPSPTPTAAPTETVTAAGDQPTSSTSKSRSGTLIAVLGAVALSLCAGVVVHMRGRSEGGSGRPR